MGVFPKNLSLRWTKFSTAGGSTSGDNAFRCACLGEQGRFEPSGSREDFPRENGRKCWRYFASKSASLLQRMSSLSVRRDFRRQP